MEVGNTPSQRRLGVPSRATRGQLLPASDADLLVSRRSRELARTLGWEAPFWLLMLFWGFCPSVQTPWYYWRGLPLNSKDLALVAVAAWYCLTAVLAGRRHAIRGAAAYGRLPLVAVGLVAYAGVSIAWSPMERAHLPGVLYTVVLTAATFLLAHGMFRDRSPESTRSFLARMTFFLVVTTAVYGAESLFRIGLRSTHEIGDFGIPRLCGPLFGAATGYLLLVPALAFSLQGIAIQDRVEGLWWKLVSVGVLLVGLFTLGSRGAIVAMAVFVALAVCLWKGANKVQVIALVAVLGAVAVGTLLVADTHFERVADFSCNSRQFTHETAWRIITSHGVAEDLRGAGYGAYWPWYSRGGWLGRGMPDYYLTNVFDTPYGPTLFHPHSVFLLLSVEMGLPGLLAFAYLWRTLTGLVFRFGADRWVGIVCCGLFASATAMFFDTFFFKCQNTSCIWCVYLLGVLRLADARRTDARMAGHSETADARHVLGRRAATRSAVLAGGRR